MDVSVVIPYRGGCPHRERALAWVTAQYEANGWDMVVSEAPFGPWRKAAALAPAIAASTADVLILADADCWTQGLPQAVCAVARGAPWAIPHRLVHRLTPAATEAYIAGERGDLETEQEPYQGVAGGGFVVATREVIRSIPLDARFVGWG